MLYHNNNHYCRLSALISISIAVLSGCATRSADSEVSIATASSPGAQSSTQAVLDFPVKLGAPYQVDGKTYTPEDTASYDNVGYASWYGQELAGRQTANGEVFIPTGISAAHRTLPMPSYVEVTALETGRTILVRVNDRGPFSGQRLIDLSAGAAQQLGISGNGVAAVRVRKVNPTDEERAVLRGGNKAVERIETPESLLTVLRKKLAEETGRPVAGPQAAPERSASAKPSKSQSTISAPAPEATPTRSGNDRFILEGQGTQRKPTVQSPQRTPIAEVEKAPSPVSYVVQIAAFADKKRAEALAKKAGASVSFGGGVYRVRMGPYRSQDDADRASAKARTNGYASARVLRAD
jgi:rare lipoprotein A